jgi:hypothetical protein
MRAPASTRDGAGKHPAQHLEGLRNEQHARARLCDLGLLLRPQQAHQVDDDARAFQSFDRGAMTAQRVTGTEEAPRALRHVNVHRIGTEFLGRSHEGLGIIEPDPVFGDDADGLARGHLAEFQLTLEQRYHLAICCHRFIFPLFFAVA